MQIVRNFKMSNVSKKENVADDGGVCNSNTLDEEEIIIICNESNDLPNKGIFKTFS